MIPIDQTRLAPYRDENGILEGPPGNCWAACLASILECKIDDLPDEAEHWKPGMKHHESWVTYQPAVVNHLHAKFGVILILCPASRLTRHSNFYMLYNILSGVSPRNPNILHATVALGMHIVHDPHPDHSGLESDYHDCTHEFLVKLI